MKEKEKNTQDIRYHIVILCLICSLLLLACQNPIRAVEPTPTLTTEQWIFQRGLELQAIPAYSALEIQIAQEHPIPLDPERLFEEIRTGEVRVVFHYVGPRTGSEFQLLGNDGEVVRTSSLPFSEEMPPIQTTPASHLRPTPITEKLGGTQPPTPQVIPPWVWEYAQLAKNVKGNDQFTYFVVKEAGGEIRLSVVASPVVSFDADFLCPASKCTDEGIQSFLRTLPDSAFFYSTNPEAAQP